LILAYPFQRSQYDLAGCLANCREDASSVDGGCTVEYVPASVATCYNVEIPGIFSRWKASSLTTVILVRHGETIWNLEGRVQGHGNSGLSDLGKRQAELLADRLVKRGIDVVYSSDLQRALDTIAPYLAMSGKTATSTEALREKCFGEWEGLTRADLEAGFADVWHRYHVLREIHTAVPGGESWDEVHARTVAFVRSVVVEQGAGRTVLMVGHGGALRPIILHALRAPLTSLTHLSVDNAGLTELHFKTPDDGRVVTLNDCSHLEGLR